MRRTTLLLLSVLVGLSACAETREVESQHKQIVIDSAEPNNIIANQLLLEFDADTSSDMAMNAVLVCAKSARVITKDPLLLLVYLADSKGYPMEAKACLLLPGLVRAEWNQKRTLR